jgi:histidinol dehydrogenase
MSAVAAKVAGVPELLMVTPTPDGRVNGPVLAAAALAGVDRVFRVGGAQAIGALAYGTQTIPAVDKIVGPGNAYVAAAKRRVFGHVGIDMIAGPSEVLVIADRLGERRLGCDGPLLAGRARRGRPGHPSVTRRRPPRPRGGIHGTPARNAAAARHRRGVDRRPRRAHPGARPAEACDLANRIAPEHLELAVAEPGALLDRIRHAGAIFLGHHASEALGDYCAGPNHVLPTARTARFSSPLGVYDFQKRSSLIGVSAAGAATLGRTAATLARAEGLEAHALSAEWRFKPR